MGCQSVTDDAGKMTTVEPGRREITNCRKHSCHWEAINQGPVVAIQLSNVESHAGTAGLSPRGHRELDDVGFEIAQCVGYRSRPMRQHAGFGFAESIRRRCLRLQRKPGRADRIASIGRAASGSIDAVLHALERSGFREPGNLLCGYSGEFRLPRGDQPPLLRSQLSKSKWVKTTLTAAIGALSMSSEVLS